MAVFEMATPSNHESPTRSAWRFWDRQNHTPGEELASGISRRFPPSKNGWPATTDEDWCGQFTIASEQGLIGATA